MSFVTRAAVGQTGKDYFTEKDPDFVRKSGPAWATPMTVRRLCWLLLVLLLTVTQVLVRWGALCHHPEMVGEAPPYHHYFPGVPYSDLPKIHAIFEREGLVIRPRVFYGYGSFIRFIVSTAPR